jgi:hypothetical protein
MGQWEWLEGPLPDSVEGLIQTLQRKLSEDAIADKVRGFERCKNPKIFKNLEKRKRSMLSDCNTSS